MNTDNFIRKFSTQEVPELIQNMPFLHKVHKWVYTNPTTVKVAEIFGMVLGAAAVVSLPVTIAAIGPLAIGIGLVGALVGVVSFVAYNMLDLVVPTAHDMKDHAFTPASFGAARLYYQGDVPILELSYDNPNRAGFSHGYLLGKYLDKLLGRLEFLKSIARFFGFVPDAKDVPGVMRTIREALPKEYQEELQGMCEGFNKWQSDEKGAFAKKVGVDDLLFFHLMPDINHLEPKKQETILQGRSRSTSAPAWLPAVGCTTIVARDNEKGLEVARAMDWPSFGIFGRYSLIINRRQKNATLSTVEIGLPGFVGTLTGMNAKGVCLAMNVCNGSMHSLKGQPAVFFNRHCLEQCQTVQELLQKVHAEKPLGSYHLTACDKEMARSVHFFQESGDLAPVIREYKEADPLVTTNCLYKRSGQKEESVHCSFEREETLQKFFSRAKNELAHQELEMTKLMREALRLPLIDNFETTHKVLMTPQTRALEVAFNNAYAGASDLNKVNTEPLFQQ